MIKYTHEAFAIETTLVMILNDKKYCTRKLAVTMLIEGASDMILIYGGLIV